MDLSSVYLRCSPRLNRVLRLFAEACVQARVCLILISSLLRSSLELSDTKVYEPSIRALPGTAAHFCKVVARVCSSLCSVCFDTTSNRSAQMHAWEQDEEGSGVAESKKKEKFVTYVFWTIFSPIYVFMSPIPPRTYPRAPKSSDIPI